MNSTSNGSQHSDNKSNTSADLHHFLNNQSDYNVTSQDSLFASEKKEDAHIINEKNTSKRTQTKGPTIIITLQL